MNYVCSFRVTNINEVKGKKPVRGIIFQAYNCKAVPLSSARVEP